MLILNFFSKLAKQTVASPYANFCPGQILFPANPNGLNASDGLF
jgi:hypothetical protein